MEEARTPTIAVANRKGGVAKTATAANIAAGLAEQGRRVLLIDLDQQGHATHYFDIDAPAGQQGTFHVLVHEVPIAQVAKTSRFGPDVLAGGADLVHAELHLQSSPGETLRLREALRDVNGRYDAVIIDCPPNLGHLTIAGLEAATTVLVPTLLEAPSMHGLGNIAATIRKLNGRTCPDLRIGAVLETRVDTDWPKHAKVVHAELEQKAAGLLMRATVRDSNYFSPAFDARSPITAYAPKSIGAEDTRAVVRELVERNLV